MSHRFLISPLATALVLVLGGCATQLPTPVVPSSFGFREPEMTKEVVIPPSMSYAVVMPGADGTVGRVFIRGPNGEHELGQAQQGAWLNGRGHSSVVAKDDIDRDFRAAIAARPPMPEQFVLYFELGASRLTGKSRAELPRILEKIKARQSVDISVVGHADTLGSAKANEALALKRAQFIVSELRRVGGEKMTLEVASYGERNLLVVTPDETAEQRNRRVELTVR